MRATALLWLNNRKDFRVHGGIKETHPSSFQLAVMVGVKPIWYCGNINRLFQWLKLSKGHDSATKATFNLTSGKSVVRLICYRETKVVLNGQ